MKKIILMCMAIFSLVSTATAQKKAVISAEQATHNFGEIKEDAGTVSHDFIIKNTGDMPLIITRVIASCGCTTPKWNKKPLKQGESTKLSITYDPKGRPGPFAKTISVYSNGKTGSYILTIRGEVK